MAASQKPHPNLSLLPSCSPRYNQWSEAANRLLAEVAAAEQVNFLWVTEPFITNGVINPSYTWDGTHLNAAGYAVWSERIGSVVGEHSGRSYKHHITA
jgi:lysophospholipase L1-like esterase